MSDNNRVFYAIQAVGFIADGVGGLVSAGNTVHGAQSAGMTTTFNLEQVFELGQIEIYENIENLPDVEMTFEKVLDGWPLVYHLATPAATGAALVSRTAGKVTGVLAIYPDTQESASGQPDRYVENSGLYVSALTYTFPVEGNCTESVTLVGNDKIWATGDIFLYDFTNDDVPAATNGVQRRENVDMTNSVWPTDIPGITSSGTNEITAGAFGAHLQTATVSTDLGREQLFELGKRAPYYRYVTFPIEVTTSIEVTTIEGDLVDARSDVASNLSDEIIKIRTTDNTQVYTGDKNKLSSVDYTGGDTGGGNVTCTYNYSAFNTLYVTNPDTDPKAYAHPA